MMWMLLLFGADPTGLQAAVQSADSVEVYYKLTNKSLTLRGDDIKELAKLVEIKGEVKMPRGIPSAGDHFVITVRKGDSSAKYILIEDRALYFGDRLKNMAELSDDRLGRAMRKRLDVPEPPPEASPAETSPPKPAPAQSTSGGSCSISTSRNEWSWAS